MLTFSFFFYSVRYGDADGNAGMFFLDCDLGTTQVSERISSAQYKPNGRTFNNNTDELPNPF